MRQVWRKVAMRNLGGSDNHKQLDRLYAVPDPWHMESTGEQFRFEMTNALLRAKLGHVGTILEVGCGEGHQSERLAALCDRLYGIDVSARAVERARQRVPGAVLDVGTLQAVPHTPPGGRFDLVVACEVLYYMSDVAGAVDAMNGLGDACLVTFFGPSARAVARHVDGLPGVERGWFFHDPYPWLWAFWRPDRG
jgi:2-polyprenyl-3-methyl-5-hydroxy-6-metoxy-1,4-benzoquinol methylase